MTRRIDDGAPLPRRLRAVRLESARDCRKLLGRITNQVYRGEVPPSQGAKLGYLLSILVRSFEQAEMKWAESESGTSPQQMAQQIRAAMRAASDLIPGPPGGGDDGQ